MLILDGKKIQDDIKLELKSEITSKKLKPHLAIIQVGNNQASNTYINQKVIHAKEIGIQTSLFQIAMNSNENDIKNIINTMNNNNEINGIIVQLPLPKNLNEFNIIETINPLKDVDCMTSYNVGKLFLQQPLYSPCTPNGIVEMLKRYNIPLEGKDVLIIGRSNIVGRPLVELLTNENTTVTLAHSHTKNLRNMFVNCDVIVSAVGKSNFITAEDKFKEGVTLIDVGINRNDNGKLCGDISKELYSRHDLGISAISKVPNGTGRTTVASLLQNVVKAYKIQNNIK